MKKILIFVACLLCLTLCIVSCGKDKKDDEVTAAPTEKGDVNWDDLVDGTTAGSGEEATTDPINSATGGYEVGTDDSKDWSTMMPF